MWGGSNDTDLYKLESIHLDGMRLITGATARSIIINVHKEFGGYTVMDRINEACLTMLYKIINGKAPSYLSGILSEINNCRHYTLSNKANPPLTLDGM